MCLNVGCIPSKALLHVAGVMDEAKRASPTRRDLRQTDGRSRQAPRRKHKVVGKLIGGLTTMAKGAQGHVVRGYGHFLDAHHLEVELTTGDGQDKTGDEEGRALRQGDHRRGSQAVRLPFVPDDPRIVDSTGALAIATVPKRMLVIGGGIIGLEMATVYSTLGTRIDVVEMLDGLMLGADRDLVAVWQKYEREALRQRSCSRRRPSRRSEAGRHPGQLRRRAGAGRAAALRSGTGRRGPQPERQARSARRAPGIAVSDRGFIPVDGQMRTNVPHIFAIGDIVGQPMLAHKATHEGHVAAEAAAGQKSHFDARVIPSVAYTDPEVAWVGMTEDEAKQQGIKYGVGKFPWTASGRALANGRTEGFTKLIFDEAHAPHRRRRHRRHRRGRSDHRDRARDRDGCDAVDIGKTIHPHPTLSETVGMAAEVYEGVCTDLPPPRKK